MKLARPKADTTQTTWKHTINFPAANSKTFKDQQNSKLSRTDTVFKHFQGRDFCTKKSGKDDWEPGI